jgi:hypothetical protein
MKGHAPLTLVLAAIVCLFVGPAHAQEPREAHLWTGTFTYAGGSGERSAIEKAISQATRAMGPLARRVARSRLETKTKPDPRIEIRVDERQVGIAAGVLWATPPDGRARMLRDAEGDAYRVAQRVVGHRIFQEIRDEDLVIRNVFALSADGSKLAIRVSLSHERLPKPLTYELTYRRTL